MLGVRGRTTVLPHQTLKTLRTKMSINAVPLCPVFRKTMELKDGVVQYGVPVTCDFSAMYTLDVSKPQCMFCILKVCFSLTKDIRIKLILYYQTLYTTEVANNTELKNAVFCFCFFLNILTFLSSATQESTVQNNSLKLTRTVTWSIKGYTVSTKQTDLYSLLHVAKPLATRGKGRWGLTNWG